MQFYNAVKHSDYTFDAGKMWKKVQKSRLRDSKIGPPILTDTTLDPTVLQSISENPVAKNQNVGNKEVSKDLPALPT